MPHGSTRLIVVRHGETDWNVEARIQGQLDIGLNANGRRQAARLAGALADDDVAAVYTSDLSRAFDTAAPVAAKVGRPLVTDTGLRERGFGAFEGLTFAEIAARWPDDSRRWRERDIDFAPGGGESLREFHSRSVGCAERLVSRHRGEAIVLVAHGGVLDCLYRAALRIDLRTPRSWVIGNARINRLLHSDSGFTLVGWGDDCHLESDSAVETVAHCDAPAVPASAGCAA